MNKLLAIAVVLVLAGQGCAGLQTETDVQTDTSADIQMQEEAQDNGTQQDTSVDVEADIGHELDDSKTEVDSDTSAEAETETDEEPIVDNRSTTIDIRSGNFFFAPDFIQAQPDQEVTVNFAENDGVHTFVIDELNVKAQIQKGGSTTFTAPSEPGQYPFYCDVGNHRAQGMEGVLIVE